VNEPRRLIDEEGTPFERSLLSALASERPSPELARRMRQGLAVAGVAATAKVATASWLKVALVGLASAGAGAGYFAYQHRTAEKPPIVAPPPPAPTVVLRVVAAPEPVASVTPSVAPPAVPSVRARPVASGAGDLREEIRLLDQARAAVRAGSHARALKLLESYERRYPRGQFLQEAQVLRVEALGKSGNVQAAHALGKKFLAEHPDSPHVERVESVTGAR
jgi:TolA-binding protein